MSHRWEYEDEYLHISSTLRRARKEGNLEQHQDLQARKDELDAMMWHSLTEGFPELAAYQTVREALEQIAAHIGCSFPDLNAPANKTDEGKFIFGVSDGIRTVQIWPLDDRRYYSVEVFEYGEGYEQGRCYKGRTTSLEEATILLSRWFVERCSIEELHTQLPWMSREPFKLEGPRMTME